MKSPVIAIGLESAEPILLQKWMSQGYLKHLHRLRQEGGCASLSNIDHHVAETEWMTILTGCWSRQTGYWGPLQFNPDNYYPGKPIRAYDFREYPPFYALGADYRVAVFDVPQMPLSTPCEEIKGIQVRAWGAHDPQTSSQSSPPDLLSELTNKYGRHPALGKGFGDNWWNEDYLTFLTKALKVGISRRAAIYRDLLRREKWDLFLTAFGETHSAGHSLWHLSQPDHPLYRQTKLGDPLLEVFQAVDCAIGEILAEVPEDAYVLVFDTLGMTVNFNEIPSKLFLGELLYRFNFPGQVAIAPGHLDSPLPPPFTHPRRQTWAAEIWQLRYASNPLGNVLNRITPCAVYKVMARVAQKFSLTRRQGLASPYQLAAEGDPLWWLPASWYKQLWPIMKAFALPSFSDGLVRINLEGREKHGIVPIADYDSLCEQLICELHDLRDARTGQPLVKKVLRTRSLATDDDPKLPDADLIVIWEELPTDAIDSPKFGRIGPVPYHRSGGHRDGGFLIARGPGISPGSTIPQGRAIDLAPTILELLNAPIPDYYEGNALLTQYLKNA